MKVDRDLVLHVAKLARIELQESEVELFTRQLGSILQYIEKLNEVKESAGPLTFHDYLPGLIRSDVSAPSLTVEEAMMNAPEQSRQSFKVPRILP